MNIIKKLFSKQPKIFYSCVVDNHPKFYWQGCIFVNSLIKLANVSGDRIFIHLIEKNSKFEEFLHKNNVNVKYIDPWGDKKYCNKLQQLETEEFEKSDYVFFCDSDIAITTDLCDLVSQEKNNILGKIVDYDNPDITILKKIFDKFKLEYPLINTDTINNKETFEGNFNGGLYGIPSKYLVQFSSRWKYYAQEMLNSLSIRELLKEKVNHIDQISFSLALKDLSFKYKVLGFEYNCPTHIKDFFVSNNKLKDTVKVIHYHNNLSKFGLLNNVGNVFIDSTINTINETLKQNINNIQLWEYICEHNPSCSNSIINISNNIKNDVVSEMLENNNINGKLLIESIVVSRSHFKWFTKHYPRLYEYPWLLEHVGNELLNKNIADFGAGITPLPIQLASRGANVYTIDKHEAIRTLETIKGTNEWGYFDYSVINKKIKSFNNLLDGNLFQDNTFDIWYSISVVEHMPANVRRSIFKVMKDSLKHDGKLYLTIDLVKNTEDLWNMSEGKEVEDSASHGNLDGLIKELEQLGFKIERPTVIRMPESERVDIAMLNGVLKKDELI